ncbi:MAG: sugar phosphate nucleotidyltransferase [Bacteroidota bacterium]
MKPTLLVLAAGMGSRYGGLKQLDGVGPNGETIMEFSIDDAIKAGFGKVVFVIRRSFEQAFKEKFADTFEGKIEVAYAFQEINFTLPDLDDMPERTKPWGTAHAVLAARAHINEPFAVINADDYYGVEAYQLVADFLRDEASPSHYSMVGYILANTISDHGEVNRGVCNTNEAGHLIGMTERIGVGRNESGQIYYTEDGVQHPLAEDTLVSMNLFGFHHSLFEAIEKGFEKFVRANYKNPKSEYYIPLIVNELINAGKVKMSVIPTNETWYGVTYQADRPTVVAALQRLTDEGYYKSPLFEK